MIAILLGALVVSGAPTAERIRAATQPAPAPGYRLHALHLGTTVDAKRDLFIVDPSLPRRIEIAFACWLVRGDDRVILIDTGFIDPTMVEQWRIRDYRDPVTALAEVGVAPGDVTDVIITHRHWDHIGGLVRFAASTLWMTRADFEGTLRWSKRAKPKLHAVLKAARDSGRLRLTEMLTEVAPSVVVVPVGLHTPGFQYVVVHNPDGRWVFAADIGPLRANYEGLAPTGQSSDRAAARVAIETIKAVVGGEIDRIVPGHEPGLFKGARSVDLRAPGLVNP